MLYVSEELTYGLTIIFSKHGKDVSSNLETNTSIPVVV